jgi:lysophospholipase L1-like esterase
MSRTPAYLFAGDSLTEGIYGESYVARIAAALERGEAGLAGQAINAGRGADTIKALLNRIDMPLRQHRPTWVILAIGCNDIWIPWLTSHSIIWRMWALVRRIQFGQAPTTDLDQFAAMYRTLIDKAARQAGARVLVCTTSCCGERLSSPPNRQIARLNGVIKRVAADCGAPVADVWQAFVDELAPLPQPSAYVAGELLFSVMDRRWLHATSPDEMSQRRRLHLTFDGLHLNSRGADLWAQTILAALVQAQ